ncbi:hypothetical protein KP509_13G022900 [Ceratopteris richardii]|uniref:Uncharacterized protein n=1 Tax=Ceratopteris richardii TaxID=49495 RepID=A0A8T2THA9_CERRI|nr:hypothetical protein KP509_13G022900 [Ceratopteris richardii]
MALWWWFDVGLPVCKHPISFFCSTDDALLVQSETLLSLMLSVTSLIEIRKARTRCHFHFVMFADLWGVTLNTFPFAGKGARREAAAAMRKIQRQTNNGMSMQVIGIFILVRGMKMKRKEKQSIVLLNF